MIGFNESDFYKLLQEFFINTNKVSFLQMLGEFYNRTEGIIDKNNIQDELIKELQELYKKLNEEGIDDNIVREKTEFFLESSKKIQSILLKLNSKAEKSEVKTLLQTKADKNQIFSMDNMGQDIKQAMTGGSVAVVGRNAVLSDNIVNNQVTFSKLHSIIQDLFDEKYNNINLSLKPNSYWDYSTGQLTSNTGNISAVNEVIVNPNETYKISGYSSYRANLYIILNSSNEVIEVFPNNNESAVLYEDIKVTIPNSGKKLLLNSKIESPTTLKRVTEINVKDNKIKFAPNSIYKGMLENKIGGLFEPCNFSKIPVSWVNGGYFRKGNGQVVSESNSSRVKIEVKAGECYRISGCSYWEANLFYVMDKDEKIIYTYPDTNETTKYYENVDVKIPDNGVYLLVNQRNNAQESSIYINESYYIKNNIGKKWVAFGDSLTDSTTLAGKHNYTNFVADNLGLNLINLGKGGTGYLNGNGGTQQFYNRTSSIPTDTDILTVFGSFNDMFVSNLTIGNITDTGTNTLYGAINTFLKNCWNINPSMIIGIISPTPWENYWRGSSDTTKANKCVEYVNVLKNVAEYYSLPYLDLFNGSNLRPWESNIRDKYYNNADGVHPNTLAHKKYIAPKIENFIKSMLAID